MWEAIISLLVLAALLFLLVNKYAKSLSREKTYEYAKENCPEKGEYPVYSSFLGISRKNYVWFHFGEDSVPHVMCSSCGFSKSSAKMQQDELVGVPVHP